MSPRPLTQIAPYWQRSKSTGNLFLRLSRKRTLGVVFQNRQGDGKFGWNAKGEQGAGYPSEEAAISALYQKLGM